MEGIRQIESLIYAGTYTDGPGAGVYVARFCTETRALESLGLVAEVENASFLCRHPKLPVLYGISEVSSWKGAGAVMAWRIDPSNGALTLLCRQSSLGGGPCHVTIDAAGKRVIAANYRDSSVVAYHVLQDGSLSEPTEFFCHEGNGPNASRQTKAHAHQVAIAADGIHVISPDLGADQLYVYVLDTASATLRRSDPHSVPTFSGAGPRHVAFEPSGRFAYVLGELDCRIARFSVEQQPFAITLLDSTELPVPSGVGDDLPAEIAIDSSGSFLYCSNRGSDELLVYAIAKDGRLALLQRISSGAVGPRHFVMDATESYVFVSNTDGNQVRVFHREPVTGQLSDAEIVWDIPKPACAAPVAIAQIRG